MSSTVLEKIDPRVKLLALLVVSFQIFFIEGSVSLAGAGILVGIGVVLSPISFLTLMTRTLRVAWFLIFIIVLNTFTLSGSVFIELFGFYGTVEGLNEGLHLALRIVLLLAASLLYAQSTHLAELLDALENTPPPIRRFLNPMLVTAGITVNFVPLLIQSAQTIKRAQLARGVAADGTFFRQVRFAFTAALPLFVAAFRASHRLAEAMEARAYTPTIERTPFRTLRLRARDFVVLGILAVEFSVAVGFSSSG